MPMHERVGDFSVWWFPRSFCQSRYGAFAQSGTNSCTLICLVLADKIAQNMTQPGFYSNVSDLPNRAVELFSSAFNEGNSAYAHEICGAKRTSGGSSDNSASTSGARGAAGNSLCNQNLSIPDAMQALKQVQHLRFQLAELFFTHLHAESGHENFARLTAIGLTQIFNVGIELFKPAVVANASSYLFGVVIADSRTVLFTFEFPANVVFLFDSHQHGKKAGAVFAQSPLEYLFELVHWFVRMLHDVYHCEPGIFEVAFLTTLEAKARADKLTAAVSAGEKHAMKKKKSRRST